MRPRQARKLQSRLENVSVGHARTCSKYREERVGTPCLHGLSGAVYEGGFETEQDAIAEDRLRAKLLTRSLPISGPVSWTNIGQVIRQARSLISHLRQPPISPDAVRDLIRRLEVGATQGLLQRSLASALTMRAIRQSVFGALLEALKDYPDEELRTFTVINRNWVFTPDELDQITARTIKNRFRTHLNQVGITKMDGPFLAFLHGEFEPTEGVYVLHFHGFATREKADALHRLKKLPGYVRTHTGAAPIVIKDVKHRVKQFTYMLKSYWPQRTVRGEVGGTQVRDRQIRRATGRFHTQVLLWLDRQSLKDMTLFNGGWSPRKGGSLAMRALYLSIFRQG